VPITSCSSEISVEADPDIDGDAQQGEDRGDGAADAQLVADLRPYSLDAAVLGDAVAQRGAHLLQRRLLGAFLLTLRGQVDQHDVGLAEGLQHHVAEAEAVQVRAHLVEFGGAAGLDLDQQAAAEVDAEVQPLGEDQRDRAQHDQERDTEEPRPRLHEVELGFECHAADQGHARLLRSAARRGGGA
jgi:hypothetical protein